MTDADRLSEIERIWSTAEPDGDKQDIDWLIAEVKRLRRPTAGLAQGVMSDDYNRGWDNGYDVGYRYGLDYVTMLKDRLAEIKHWYALHALPQRRLVEDIIWLINRVEELEAQQKTAPAPVGESHSELLYDEG